ncbi:MAG: hypothetical protein ACPLKS_02950, partial [Caldisericum exile]|uniref:hypothetical protein n=1 Tax=Caldisericum exile TaxID=693075 RepID=UPI003C706DCC
GFGMTQPVISTNVVRRNLHILRGHQIAPSILPQTEEIPQAKAFGMTIILRGQQLPLNTSPNNNFSLGVS